MESLQTRQIAVWLLDCDQVEESTLSRLAALLSAEEMTRNQRLRQAPHRRRDLVCKGVLRLLLSFYTEQSPDSLVIERSENDKPYLAGTGVEGMLAAPGQVPEQMPPNSQLPLQFNYSHSDAWVAYAFCREAPIGVDVECVRDRPKLMAVAKRHFAEAEIEALQALPERERLPRFMHYWTLKEAYIKARGEGIYLGLGNFAFAIEGEHPSVSFVDEEFDHPRHWQFFSRQLVPQTQVAVAVRSEPPLFQFVRESCITTQDLRRWLGLQ